MSALSLRAQTAARHLSSQFASTSRFIYHRHAMMSALAHPPNTVPLPSSSSKSPKLAETQPASTPLKTPSSTKPPSAKDLSADAASPQTAARPPPLPKAERPKPKLRAAKAAITLVRQITSTSLFESVSKRDPSFRLLRRSSGYMPS